MEETESAFGEKNSWANAKSGAAGGVGVKV